MPGDSVLPEGAKPRGRPAKEGREAAIVIAALAAFSTKGFAATRLEDVALQAGISKGTIYLYFDSKEALFEGAVRQCILPHLRRMEAMPRDHDGNVSALLRAQISLLFREIASDPVRQILRLIIAEGDRFPRLVEFYFREVVGPGMKALSATLAQGVARAAFRPDAPVQYPQLLVAPAMLAAIWKILFDKIRPLDTEALLQAHLDLMLEGLLVD